MTTTSLQTPILRYLLSTEPGTPTITTAADPMRLIVSWPNRSGTVFAQRATGRFSTTFVNRVTVTADVQAFTDNDVVAGQTYTYRLRHDTAKAWGPAVSARLPGRRADYTPPDIALPRQPPRPRWQLRTFYDGDHYDFAMSPNSAGNPWAARELTYIHQTNGGYSAWRAGRAPVQWQFGGTLRTRDQLEQLRSWVRRTERLLLITDLGEVHIVRLLTLQFSQHGGGINNNRGTWQISCLVYDEATVPEIQKGNPLDHVKLF